MVLQQSHRRHAAPSSTRIDANRILGISSTLALNVLALLALMIPMSLPAPLALPEPDMQFEWIEPKPPVTPPPPERVEVVRPQTPPQPVVQRTRIDTPPVVEQIVVEDGLLQADPVVDPPANDITPPSIAPANPVQGMRLEYANAPAPAYPREAVRRQLEGTVLLQILVDVDGKPLEVSVHRSSGHRILDQEAIRHVSRHWTFRPAMKDGRAVQAIGLVPIDFRLGRM